MSINQSINHLFVYVVLIHQRHRRMDRQTDRRTDKRHAIAIPRFAL